ncbi:MAG TPA: vWA domain-containing protein [Thermoanaerobaculia bacterium]|nr:vWA domain-containing protein [Thermoanaerobaculia bacterium]
MRFRQWRALVMAMVVGLLGAGIAHAQCGPMDVVFIVDTTGSMGGAIDNVKAELPAIITQIQNASGGDFRLGLVEFKDEVIVVADIAGGNIEAITAGINGLSASGGASEPEASDEAIKTVIRGLRAADRGEGQQTGDFVGGFRPEATKIVILITDARPAGFDDRFTAGVDDAQAAALATEAATKGIRISAVFVPTSAAVAFDVVETVRTIMQSYASLSGGIYVETEEDGTGTADAVKDIIAGCGGFGGVRNIILDPSSLALSNGESADVKLQNYRPGDLATLFYTAEGLPEDSTITFTKAKPEVEGTDQQTVKVTIGPETFAGTYQVIINAEHKDQPGVQRASLLVVVDCVPPFILGLPGNQPENTTAGADGRATLKVVASGSAGFRYQWYQGWSGSTAFPIAGANSETLITPAVTTATPFWVRISNACGSRDSRTAVVTP